MAVRSRLSAELDGMPEDGRRYELLNGALVVSPWPTTVHQSIVARLAALLDRACPRDLCVLPAPALSIDPLTEFVPDGVVVWTDQVGGAELAEPPLLVVEVRSPSTAVVDLNRLT
jgi:Uma2 family endonuclease